jgi:hypothetical protein
MAFLCSFCEIGLQLILLNHVKSTLHVEIQNNKSQDMT